MLNFTNIGGVSIKPKLLIIEGSQGSGKSSITKGLREHMLSTTLISLSGIKKDLENSKLMTYVYHSNIISMIKESHQTQMNFVLDRSYLSEYVYTRLGYKEYSFESEFNDLTKELLDLTTLYDVHVVLLTTTEEEYKTRLQRDKAVYQSFSVESSIKQQEEYAKVVSDLPLDITTHIIDTTGIKAEDVVLKVLELI